MSEEREDRGRSRKEKRNDPDLHKTEGGRKCCLFVGNLADQTSWQDLKDHMRQAGDVVRADVLKDKRTKKSKGFGYVEFQTVQDAEKAIEKLNRTDLNGKLITVCWEDEAPPEKENGPDVEQPYESNRVFVNGLPHAVAWQAVKDHMRQAGRVLHVELKMDRDGRPKGNALVEYSSPTEALNAIKTLNETDLQGRTIYVREDREPQQRGAPAKKPRHWEGEFFDNREPFYMEEREPYFPERRPLTLYRDERHLEERRPYFPEERPFLPEERGPFMYPERRPQYAHEERPIPYDARRPSLDPPRVSKTANDFEDIQALYSGSHPAVHRDPRALQRPAFPLSQATQPYDEVRAYYESQLASRALYQQQLSQQAALVREAPVVGGLGPHYPAMPVREAAYRGHEPSYVESRRGFHGPQEEMFRRSRRPSFDEDPPYPARSSYQEHKPQREPPRERKGFTVFVGNLNFHTSWQELKDLMRQVGEVLRADIKTDASGLSKGCAIVEYRNESSVAAAIEKLQGVELEGRKLYIQEDHGSKKSTPGTSRGGGVGGGNNTRVYVDNLDYSVETKDLKEFCSQVGGVVQAKVMQDENGRSKGYGLVEFENVEDAANACKVLNDKSLLGRQVNVYQDRGTF